MPKTRKQVKRVKHFRLFSAMSPAKGMIVFMLAFAVLGGSYLAYKSFAATGDIVYYWDKITPHKGTGFIDPLKVKEPGKANLTVWRVYKGNKLTVPATTVTPWAPTDFRICAYINNVSSTKAKWRLRGTVGPGFGEFNLTDQTAPSIATGGSNGYQKVCSSPVRVAATTRYYTVNMSFDRSDPNDDPNAVIHVSNMSVQWVQ